MQLARLRNDLEIIPRLTNNGGLQYIIKDPRSGEISSLREEDYFIIHHIDGKTPLSNVQSAFTVHFGHELPRKQLEAFIRQLKTLGLLEGSPEDQPKESTQPRYPGKVRRIGDPNRFFQRFTPWLGWCFSWSAAALFGLLCFLAAGIAIKFAGDFVYDVQALLASGKNVIFIVLGVLMSSFFEELAKGAACTHYGGSVHSFGMHFIFNSFPRFYCDLSDVPWMPNKLNRIRILSAGLIFQIFMLSFSVVMWKKAVPLTTMDTVWVLLVVIFLWALFLNANPLHSRDGYYLLMNIFNVPDLKNRAGKVTFAWLRRKPLPEPLTAREVWAFKWYFVLSLCFVTWLVVTILAVFGYMLIANLEGAGACIFAFILFRFFRSFKPLQRNKQTEQK